MTMDDNSSVYVGGLSFDSTEDMLRNVFEAYGDIMAVKIIYDKESGHSRGFGFVTFTNPRAAGEAIHAMDGGLIAGRTIRVNEVKKITSRTMASKREGALNRDSGFQRERDRDRENSEKDRDRGSNGYRGTMRGLSPTTQKHHSMRLTRGRKAHRSPKRGRSASNYSSPSKKRSRSPYSASPPGSQDRLQKVENVTSAPVSPFLKRNSKQREMALEKIKEDLDNVIQSRQELERKVAKLECSCETKDQNIQQLQTKSKKLEGRVVQIQSAISHRKIQMRKLKSGIKKMRDFGDLLKSCEKEFKVLTTIFGTELEGEEAGEVVQHEKQELIEVKEEQQDKEKVS